MAQVPVKMSLAALDIGNVCIRLNKPDCVSMFGIQEIPQELRELAFSFSIGVITPEQFAEKVKVLLKTDLAIPQILEKFAEQIGPAMPGMEEVIREGVEHGVRFVFLSDTNITHMTKIRRTVPFCHLVTGSVLSYEVHVCKPSLEIYRIFEERYGKPDIYADDLAANIESASALGWNAHHFTSVDRFHEALKKIYN